MYNINNNERNIETISATRYNWGGVQRTSLRGKGGHISGDIEVERFNVEAKETKWK